jgi:hypothetical protein
MKIVKDVGENGNGILCYYAMVPEKLRKTTKTVSISGPWHRFIL